MLTMRIKNDKSKKRTALCIVGRSCDSRSGASKSGVTKPELGNEMTEMKTR